VRFKYKKIKIERIKEFIKLMNMQQKKIAKYLCDYTQTQEKILTMHKGQRVTSWIKKANTSLNQHYSNFFEKNSKLALSSPMKKKHVEIQTSPSMESTSNWANITSPILVGKKSQELLFNPNSLLKPKPMGTATNLSELFLTGESLPIFPTQHYHNHSLSQPSGFQKPSFGVTDNHAANTCCCYKDKLLNDQQMEIQKLQQQLREKDSKHTKENKKLKDKFQGIKSSQNQIRAQYIGGLKSIKMRLANGCNTNDMNRFIQKLIDEYFVTSDIHKENEDYFSAEEDLNINLQDDLLSFRLKINH